VSLCGQQQRVRICHYSVVDTVEEFFASVIDTGKEFFTSVVDTDEEFVASVIATGKEFVTNCAANFSFAQLAKRKKSRP
jgi:hypothetical protein